MHIKLNNICQKFDTEYIIKNLSIDLCKQHKYAITGYNGSGKSTLIKIISFLITPTSGEVQYLLNDTAINKENSTKYVNVLAPYLEPDYNLSLNEQLNLYKIFRPTYNNLSIDKILDIINLYNYKDKNIHQLSSGMKQRLKLALAFCYNAEIILLDEPTSYLDKYGTELYHYFLKEYTKNRTIIIASNQKHEIAYCDTIINLD